MSSKTENLIQAYGQAEPISGDKLRDRRQKSKEKQDRLKNRLLTVATVGILAVVGASEINHHLSMPPLRTVNETVQPKDYENPSLVAQRAEQELGRDPADFNVQQSALRIAENYGQLYPGERIQVQVR